MTAAYGTMHHPYFPEHVSIPTFAPNTTPIPVLLGLFGGTMAVVVLTSLTIARRKSHQLSTYDQLTFCWFVLCPSVLSSNQ